MLRETRFGQPLAKRGALRVAGAVVQLERAALLAQLLGHGHERRDADAAREQDGLRGAIVEWEMILRRTDFKDRAGFERVHRDGAAARSRVAQYADAVGARFGGAVAKRVLAHESIDVDVDMGARLERWERRAVGARQFENADVGG